MNDILVFRPEPGAFATGARAEALGLVAIMAPIFTIQPIDWRPPEDAFDTVLMTSANAARHGGAGLASFRHLPCYAVGEATAGAAREAGFADVRVGLGDGAAVVEMMARDGVHCAFHPCGRDHMALEHRALSIVRRAVYSSDAVARLPENARVAMAQGTVALLHSARAAELLARLVPEKGRMAIAAISDAAAQAAGPGWKRVAVAARPSDEALLELAAKLCQTGGERQAGE